MFFALTEKPGMGARLYTGLIGMASDPVKGVDATKMIQHMAGVLVETYMVFDQPDEAMAASLHKLGERMECKPIEGKLPPHSLPPAHIIDAETEKGRLAARGFFEEWLDCAFEFHNLMLVIVHNVLQGFEDQGLAKDESLRLLVECTHKCMAFEIASQELCDIVIERKIATEFWSLGDCVAALSAVSGRRVALSLNAEFCELFEGSHYLPQYLDHVVCVMTKEAVRLGVPAGTDWRFGLPANDTPVNAPLDLIYGIEPFCDAFFGAINMTNHYDQAVACAKAAGRMLAVAAGGEVPDLEPAIAKPLAMAAMTETYKSVCMTHNMVTM
ncbi:MAG: hypothetical protein KTR28_01060 [Micavibrio sp.]|nr:hypothetical protein [Micavibrio sp.]